MPTDEPPAPDSGPEPEEAGSGERVLVGLVARAHGLKGEVVVEVLSDAPERFMPGSGVVGSAPGSRGAGAIPLVVAESRPFQGRLLVRFEGFESREDAEAVHGYELTIARSQVAPLPEGQHYRFQLVGLEVRTAAGASIGTVSDVFSTGSNDVLVVDGEDQEILVPMLEGVIVSIDPDGAGIVIEPPPGLPGLTDE